MPSYLVPESQAIPPVFRVNSPDHLVFTQTNLGISISRDIITFLSTGPMVGASKVVIINSAHLMTPEAQTALLKILEEPPQYAHLFLVTPSPHLLLPTIISRCFQTQSTNNPPPDPAATVPAWLNFPSGVSAGQRLSLIPPQSHRPELLTQLASAIAYFHPRFTESPSPDLARRLRLLLVTHHAVSHSANLNLSLANLVLSW